jgi:hypothetical protein
VSDAVCSWLRRWNITDPLAASTLCCSVDLFENNEMGRACSTYGGKERCMQGFGGET